jgi:hypothetical protein
MAYDGLVREMTVGGLSLRRFVNRTAAPSQCSKIFSGNDSAASAAAGSRPSIDAAFLEPDKKHQAGDNQNGESGYRRSKAYLFERLHDVSPTPNHSRGN